MSALNVSPAIHHATATAGAISGDLGDLPAWNLADLYASPTDFKLRASPMAQPLPGRRMHRVISRV